ncbi:MAG TPA: ATP-binding protein [Anaeromyxobacteraceae bacterium]|nr:ATP-binding protein [Anaeromyxobacteraceae bacterium]
MIRALDRARTWLERIPAANELQRRHAVSLQVLAIAAAVLTVAIEVSRGLSGATSGPAMVTNVSTLGMELTALWALRTGRFRLGSWIFAVGMALVLGGAIAASGITYARDVVRNLTIPLALAALLLGRRALWASLSIMVVLMAVGLARDHRLLSGGGPVPNPMSDGAIFGVSVVVLTLLAIVLDRFALTVLEAFEDSESRRHQLETATAEATRASAALVGEMNARRRVETQLIQAQRMEALGRLAGGVAHDFNNLLTVIGANAQALSGPLPAAEVAPLAVELREAVDRAASLTRQLLAFTRHQILEPEVMDLSIHLTETLKLVRRLLPENVTVDARLRAGLEPVRADRGQIDQILMNLCVNARDAMPVGGHLLVETDGLAIDADTDRADGGLPPGRYVRLTVSDSGVGMPPGVRDRIFEPFYTTKEKGKGTGLGLAMVYGAARQHGGAVTVQSEPGRGATFQVYLPVATEPDLVASAPPPRPPTGGTETVLLVEDDPQVRKVAARMLEKLGYDVLAAAGGTEALMVEAAHAGPIHLLVTDVIMPGLNGRELADRLVARRPGLGVVYTSGYTGDIIESQGVLASRGVVLGKPFTVAELAMKVREALAASGGDRAGERPSHLPLISR